MVGCCKLSLYANGSCDEHYYLLFSAMIEMMCNENHFGDLWQWCNFSGIEAVEFSFIYTRVQRATAEVFPVVANTRSKSIL